MEAMAKSPLWLAFIATMVMAEALLRLRSGRGYDRRTALASVGLLLGGVPFAALHGVVVAAIYSYIWSLAPIRLPLDDWRTWLAGFFLLELAYYWFHRTSHRVRWLWVSHSVHHSSEQLTLLSSFRLGWTSLLSAGWLFYAPLVLVGFDPRLIVGLLVFNLRFQTFLHTELIGRLGPLEWVFNTPAHHRLHHACNDTYIDRNFGGVLIVYDRLFGSLATERPDEPIRYGLAHRGSTANPLTIAFREWRIMASEILTKRGRGLGRTLFGAP